MAGPTGPALLHTCFQLPHDAKRLAGWDRIGLGWLLCLAQTATVSTITIWKSIPFCVGPGSSERNLETTNHPTPNLHSLCECLQLEHIQFHWHGFKQEECIHVSIFQKVQNVSMFVHVWVLKPLQSQVYEIENIHIYISSILRAYVHRKLDWFIVCFVWSETVQRSLPSKLSESLKLMADKSSKSCSHCSREQPGKANRTIQTDGDGASHLAGALARIEPNSQRTCHERQSWAACSF